MFRKALFTLFVATIATPVWADEADDRMANAFLEVARDPMATVPARVSAVKSLGRMGPKAAVTVPGLTRLLNQSRHPHLFNLQEATIETLGQIGAPSRPALAAITREAGRDTDIDLAVARSVDAILTAAEEPDLPALMKQIRHRHVGTRLRAVKSLGMMGTRAAVAAPLISGTLGDEDADVRRAAVVALRQVQPDVPPGDAEAAAIAMDLRDPFPANRLRALKILSTMGAAANAATDALTAALDDRDPDVRRLAQDVLGHLPPPAPKPTLAPAPGPG